MTSRWRRLAVFPLVVAFLTGCVRLVPASADDPCAVPEPMPSGAPERIAIEPDDFQARHVGHTADGRQFFLTTPFEPGAREFVALYLFRADGMFTEARIDAFDPGERAAADRAHRRLLRELGDVTIGRISVAPFAVERFGTTFGLISAPPQGPDDVWWVTAEPGDYMAFSPPWDCGTYDT
ncbi:hypothetical protein AB0G04_04850 [Actinoplanes sp. NPDC023801]|uniref:hypothetical protein n=1 Tax=Actinoplanes sp. NPDC023801 TaxID=3154595 RepID=UPI0033D1DDFF